jgi:hypothetical protein
MVSHFCSILPSTGFDSVSAVSGWQAYALRRGVAALERGLHNEAKADNQCIFVQPALPVHVINYNAMTIAFWHS